MSVTSPIEAPPRQDPETVEGDRPRGRHDGRQPRRGRLHRRSSRACWAPDGYGSLAALLNLTVILFVPGSALQVAAAREGTLGRLGRGRRAGGHAAALDAPHPDRARGRRRRRRSLVREPLAALLNVEQEWAAAAVPVTGVLWLLLCLQRGLLQSARAYRAVGLSVVLEALGPAGGRRSPSSASALGVTGAYLGTLASLARRRDRALGSCCAAGSARRRPARRQHPLRAARARRRDPDRRADARRRAAERRRDHGQARRSPTSAAGVYAATTVAAKAVVWIAVGLGLLGAPRGDAPRRRGRRPARRARPRARA